ncbi:hypothetical protein O0L34_g15257 [Tuta absoluta]|nr:hypothetical protein O0L34_g15257 [Tuta absoluta]
MAAKYVKCSSCNIVINEVLAFMNNKLRVLDEETLLRICNTAFKDEDILEAKTLLFAAVPLEKFKRRKKQDKSRKELQDIIDLLKHIDATDPEKLPIFVAKELHKLPPVTFDHLDATRILRDILKIQDNMVLMQNDMQNMKKEFVTRKEVNISINSNRQSSSPQKSNNRNNHPLNFDTNNINLRRGACLMRSFEYDSGPMGIHQALLDKTAESSMNGVAKGSTGMHNSLSHTNAQAMGEQMTSAVPLAPAQVESSRTPHVEAPNTDTAVSTQYIGSEHAEATTAVSTEEQSIKNASDVNTVYGAAEMSESMSTYTIHATQSPPLQHAPTKRRENCTFMEHSKKPTFADMLNENENKDWKDDPAEKEWNLVIQKRKLRNRFISSQGKASDEPDIKFKAAGRKVPLYISNVCQETQVTDIEEYIKKKTRTQVKLEKIAAKVDRGYNSFLFYVDSFKVPQFLNDELWPEGIRFRKFVIFKKDRASAVIRNK